MPTHWARCPDTSRGSGWDSQSRVTEGQALTEGRCYHSEGGNTLRTSYLERRHACSLSSYQKHQASPVPTNQCPAGPGTHLKNRGWCSTPFSSKVRRLSLCSCSILCFCISASSTFPSSRNLRCGGRNKGTEHHGNTATSLLKPQVSKLDSPNTLLYTRPFSNP